MILLRVYFHQDMTQVYEGNLGLFMDMLRVRMEMEHWKRAVREAEQSGDLEELCYLHGMQHEVGVPG